MAMTTVNQKSFDYAILCLEPQSDDCRKIIEVARRSFGIEVTLCEASKLWKWWSKKFAAQWLTVDTGAIQTAIVEFIKQH